MIRDERNNSKAYLEIANYLREQIYSGKISPNTPLLTENELSDKFRVSRGPVRQAMKSLVDEGIIYRVAGRGTFVSDSLYRAKQDSSTKSLNIAVIVEMESLQPHQFLLNIIEGLNVEAQKSCPVCKLTYQFDADAAELFRHTLTRTDIDGVIFIAMQPSSMSMLKNLTVTDGMLPFVSLFRKIGNPKFSQFSVNHEAGSFRGTDYLLKLGHTRIAALLMAPVTTRIDSFERLKGYRKALQESGIGFDDKLVIETGLSPISVTQQLSQLLHGAEPPTALLVGGNALLPTVAAALRKLDLRIPEDISVIVFDDSPEAAYFTPPLSVIRQPSFMVAHYGLEKLMSMILLNDSSPCQIEMNPELIIRDSCGNRDKVKKSSISNP